MPRTASDLYNEALQLPEAERVYLADLLEASVDATSIEQAWLDEAHQRLEAIDAGEAKLVRHETVTVRLRNNKVSG